MKTKRKNPQIDLSICAGALQTVFDECDRYDQHETGGRILGVFESAGEEGLKIKVNGIIESGPKARRSVSSFFQDGEYQAQVFRTIERMRADIEHLGNWHTHHVNGFPTLSSGDIATYRRIVNHEKHNLNFFYALLVVTRNSGASGLDRYHVRHYVLFREDETVYEIAPERVSVIDEPLVWPTTAESAQSTWQTEISVRVGDKSIIECFYPEIRPNQSRRTNTFYWRGTLQLINRAVVQLTIPELTSDDEQAEVPFYQVLVKDLPETCSEEMAQLGECRFRSAAEAIRNFEQRMNMALYQTACERKGK